MSKKAKDSKILAIRVPIPLFEKFKEKCDKETFGMSEIIRLYIRDFAEHGFELRK